MKYVMKCMEICKRTAKDFISFRKEVFILAVIYGVAISAIIRANFYYIDDLGRASQGYRGWEAFSRYISNYLSVFLHGDTYLTDISPLPQLLAVLFIALAGVCVISVFSGGQRLSWLHLFSVLPMGLSPYFLECFSYKYDSPYMALSVLAGVFPFMLLSYGLPAYAVTVVFCVLITDMTYQAASGIFPVMTVFLCFQYWNRKQLSVKQNIKLAAVSLFSYLSGMLIFKLFLMNPISNYVDNSILPPDKLFAGAWENLCQYYKNILADFKREWLVLTVCILLAFLIMAVMDSAHGKVQALVVALLAELLGLALAFGLYPFLQKPLFSMRAMYGFGVLLAILAVQIVSARKNIIGKAFCIVLSWCFFSFSFTYGNALAEQKRYADFRVQMVIDDLNDLEVFSTDSTKKLKLSGTIGQSPIIRNMPQDYQALNRLLPVMFAENWMWSEMYFYRYFGLKNIEQLNAAMGTDASELDFSDKCMTVWKDTMYHTISGDGEYFLIELH